MRTFLVLALTVLAAAAPTVTSAQTPRDRARIHNRLGWEHMRAEQYAEAAKAFQTAIDLARDYELPYYGLGRADLALKKYVEAIAALETCRELYQGQAARRFSNAHDAQRFREDRLIEIDEQIRIMQAATPTARTQDTVRQLQNHRRNIQEYVARGSNISLDTTAPAWVLLSLGSAYFRAGRLADAEREYKATIDSDSKAGEAHNNLAVVYLETGRYAEAEGAVKEAKKVGFRVSPQLEQEIKERKRTGS